MRSFMHSIEKQAVRTTGSNGFSLFHLLVCAAACSFLHSKAGNGTGPTSHLGSHALYAAFRQACGCCSFKTALLQSA